MENNDVFTPKQEEQIEEWYNYCLNEIGMSTQTDYASAAQALTKIYEADGLRTPRFFNCASPRHAKFLISILKTASKLGLEKDIPDWFDEHEKSLDCFDWFNINPKDFAISNISSFIYGAWDICWAGRYIFAQKFLDPNIYHQENAKLLELWFQICQSCGLVYAFEKCCFICAKPTVIKVNSQGSLHCVDGPALRFVDGIELYFYKGVDFTDIKNDLLHPELITVDRIFKENNQEIKRALVELYGYDRFIKDHGAELIHEDEFGKLWKKDIPGDEPLVMVELVNSTPEPDGTRKIYFERVHPELRPMSIVDGNPVFGNPQKLTCHNAVASQFGLYGHEYNPILET